MTPTHPDPTAHHLRDFAWLLLALCVVIIGGAGILEWRMG